MVPDVSAVWSRFPIRITLASPMKPKPWQIVIIALGLVVGVGSIVYAVISGSWLPVSSVTHCVDIETGDCIGLAARSSCRLGIPESGKICLVRVTKDDDGQWIVKRRDLQSMANLPAEVKNAAVDPETRRAADAPEGRDQVPYEVNPRVARRRQSARRPTVWNAPVITRQLTRAVEIEAWVYPH